MNTWVSAYLSSPRSLHMPPLLTGYPTLSPGGRESRALWVLRLWPGLVGSDNIGSTPEISPALGGVAGKRHSAQSIRPPCGSHCKPRTMCGAKGVPDPRRGPHRAPRLLRKTLGDAIYGALSLDQAGRSPCTLFPEPSGPLRKRALLLPPLPSARRGEGTCSRPRGRSAAESGFTPRTPLVPAR